MTLANAANNKMIKFTAENQERVGTAGGVETVLKVINAHVDDLMACKQGCETLLSLISDCKLT